MQYYRLFRAVSLIFCLLMTGTGLTGIIYRITFLKSLRVNADKKSDEQGTDYSWEEDTLDALNRLHGICDQIGFLFLILATAFAMCLIAEAIFFGL